MSSTSFKVNNWYQSPSSRGTYNLILEGKANFSAITHTTFDGTNYQMWVVIMGTHLEAFDLWEAVEEDYEVHALHANPTMAQMKVHKERKKRNQRQKVVYL